jgi:hypothetical protein
MKTKRSFDCVEMKRRGSAGVQAELAGMSREEQLEFWRQQTADLLELQRTVVEKKKDS